MQKLTFLRRIIPLALVSWFTFGCEDPQDIRFDLGFGGRLATFFTDTLSVRLSSTQLDSVVTSGTPELFLGGYQDPIFGYVQADFYVQPYFQQSQFNPNELIPFDVPATATLDSVFLVMNYNGYFQGDSISPVKVDIFQLNTPVLRDRRYTRHDQIPTKGERLASFEMNRARVTNVRGDTLFSLATKLPESILAQLRGILGQPASTDVNQFVSTFPGFLVQSSGTPKGIYSFRAGTESTTSSLRVFYRLAGETTVRAYTFPFTAGRFTRYQTNRSGTILSNMALNTPPIPASQTQNRAFFQSGTGVAAVLEIPSISSILQRREVAINRADLVISLDSTLIAPRLVAPSVIVLAELDDQYQVAKTSNFTPILVPINALNPTVGQGGLFLNTTKSYAITLTPYLQRLASEGRTRVRLGILPGGLSSSTSTAAAINQSGVRRAGVRQAQLRLYYTFAQ